MEKSYAEIWSVILWNLKETSLILCLMKHVIIMTFCWPIQILKYCSVFYYIFPCVLVFSSLHFHSHCHHRNLAYQKKKPHNASNISVVGLNRLRVTVYIGNLHRTAWFHKSDTINLFWSKTLNNTYLEKPRSKTWNALEFSDLVQ